MKRIEKVGEVIVRPITLPLRICIGAWKSVEKICLRKIEVPIEIKRKEENNGDSKSTN